MRNAIRARVSSKIAQAARAPPAEWASPLWGGGNRVNPITLNPLICDYIHLEYVRIHVIYRVNQTEYVIHMLVVAPEKYVNHYWVNPR